jgi:hypothetical protein
MRNNLLQSTACGQNLDNKQLRIDLVVWSHSLRHYDRLFGLWKARLNVTGTLNHLIHHRAQLGVYLRLNGKPVPAIYGPSADDTMGF